MTFGRDFSNFGYFIKKHLDVFNKQIFYKLVVLTAIIIFLVVFLALLFLCRLPDPSPSLFVGQSCGI